MRIDRILINKLKPATYNPRQITKKQYSDLKDVPHLQCLLAMKMMD